MPTFDFIQASFAGGELSPRMRGQVTSDVYKAGTATSRNWMHTPQGSVKLCNGSWYVSKLHQLADFRLFGFRRTNLRNCIFELNEGAGYLSYEDGTILEGSFDLLTNGSFDSGVTGWTSWGGITIENSRCRFSTNTNPHGQITHTANISLGAGAKTYRVSFEAAQKSANVVDGTVYLTKTFTAPHNINPGDILSQNTFTPNAAAAGGNYGRKKSFSYDITLTNEANVYLAFDFYDGFIDNVRVYEVGAGVTSLPAPWADTELEQVQFIDDTASDRVILLHPNVAPHVLRVYDDDTWTLAPATLTAAVWWEGSNFPACGELVNGRLVLAGEPEAPDTVTASKAGAIFDFTLGDNAADAFRLQVATKGAVRWIKAQGRWTLLGTDVGEYSLSGTNGIFSPGDFGFARESFFGSAALQSVEAGPFSVYVSRDRRKVHSILYNQDINAQNSEDLTFHAEHITRPGLKELHYAGYPNGFIIGLTDDGSLAVCTIDKTGKVLAWWLLDVGAPVMSACVTTNSNGAELWLGVQRDPLDTGAYLERIPLYEQDETFMFCSHKTTLNGASGLIAHPVLRGIVGVTLDGQWYGSHDLDTNGELTVAVGPIAAITGLTAFNKVKLLKQEGGNPRGTSQGNQQRFSRLRLRVNDSIAPLVNGDRPPDRNVSGRMDQAGDRTTEDLTYACLGWDNGELEITQDIPLRTEVLAVFGKLTTEEV